MDLNSRLFLKINSLIGRSQLLDHFGRAGGEWVIVGMAGWFFASALINGLPDKSEALLPVVFFFATLSIGWLVNLGLAVTVKEPRPFVTYPHIRTLFRPLMTWRSFPSDHAMAAFTMVFNGCIFHLPGAWALVPMALWVVWGRVYAGVHYPLDILGGVAVSAFVATIGNFVLKVIV